MTDPASSPLGPRGPQQVQPDAALPSTQRSADGGAAFKALLEKLEGHAREARQTGNVERPDELAGAADRAKASITDALSLRDQLLEAYRAAQQRGEDPS